MKIKVRSFAGFRHVLLEALCASRPALCPMLFSGEDLRVDVNVFVSGKSIVDLRGLQMFLVNGDEVALFPAAISG